jgi:ABC-type multidrug transport system fused ATPase/permease subunit
MRTLPEPDPGVPDLRSPLRFLLWNVRRQARTVAAGALMGVLWMVSSALFPAAIGRAVDAGITANDHAALVRWTGVLLALGLLQAGSGVLRHRAAVSNWLSASMRTVQLVTRQAALLGGSLSRRVATGEVVSIGTADINHIGGTLDITARGSGAVVALATVSVILLRTSVPLGLVVLLGVPALLAVVSLLIRPLHRRQQAYRDEQGALTTRAADIVTGLRVLRGIGGEASFAGRYAEHSQRLRAAGVAVGRVQSALEAAQVLLPGLLVAVVTWLGARFALGGHITVGQLIAFYGYAAFLVVPLRTLTELVERVTRGHVAARRVVDVLRMRPELPDPAEPAPAPAGTGELVDPGSGLCVRPGVLTVVAAERPAEAEALALRLGRYVDAPVTLDGVPLAALDLATVRRLVLVTTNEDHLFSGVLREVLDPSGRAGDAAVLRAVEAAGATDVVEALPEGLSAPVAERGREFSGGQQQRLRLARALLADPPVLVAVEPTSAVDAHTEAAVAARLGGYRAGRTTVVCSTSPLVLDRADHVVFLSGGRVLAEGTHRGLLETCPEYAAVVTRGEDDPVPALPAQRHAAPPATVDAAVAR